jgi:hypothetical protein
MKKVFLGIAVLLLSSCSAQQESNSDIALQARVAALEKTVSELKPGLGEIMGVVQQHHAKLYYSGSKGNWPLAEYELGEIQEGLDDAMKYYPTFQDVKEPLTTLIPSLTKASLAQVRTTIENKDEKSFVEAFKTLSGSCSSCHAAANHPFVKIQIPTDAMFSNQKFAP